MPRHDPIPSPRGTALRRFRRVMKWMGIVSVATAAAAVALVAWGGEGRHAHLLIATALGVGFTVLLATALMSLTFLSSSSGHDEQASRFEQEEIVE